MRVAIRDASYWYEVHGEGETVVLLHGFTGSTNTWRNFVASYQSQFMIVVIDLPGHGKTTTPSPVTMKQCCRDIHNLLKGIGIDSFHLVGYSMGGRTALSYAMHYQEQIKSLTLESASPGLESEEERHNRIANDEKLAMLIEQQGVESFVNYWQDIPLFASQKRLPVEVQETIRNERLSQSKEGLALSLRSMGTGSQSNWWTSLPNLFLPVLLIVGELDLKFITINKKMQKALPNSELTVVENTGHAIHVERDEFFGKIVEEFILANGN